MDFIVIFDVIIGGLGIYLVYSAFQMKRSGEISTIIMNREDIIKCKDKRGFIDYIYGRTLIFGLLSLIFGILGGINDSVYSFGRFFNIVGVTIFIIVWLWFTHELKKGRDRYFY